MAAATEEMNSGSSVDGDDASSLESSVDADSTKFDSSHPDGTSGNDSTSSSGDQPNIAKSETAAVFRLRVVVIIVLLIVASVVSAVVLSITQSGETDEFETQFAGAAHVVQTSFENIVENLSAISAIAVVDDHSAAEDYAGADWPFRTIYNFKERASNARQASRALSISVCPIVTIDEREVWEQYVNGPDSAWIEHAMAYQEKLGLNKYETNQDLIHMSAVDNESTVDPIKYFDPETGKAHILLTDGPYLPVWQTSPLLQQRTINENIFTRPVDAALAKASIDNREAVLGGFTSAPFGNANNSDPATSQFATLESIMENDHTHYLGEPFSHFFLPLHSNTDLLTSTDEGDVAAIVMSVIPWRSYFRHTLPAAMPPVQVVLESTCGGLYTYEIQGQEAYIVGAGDQHDPSVDKYRRDAWFSSQHLRDGTVSGLNISQDFGCQYMIHIYPTQIFMETFLTDTPLAITFAIAIVFLFTICMFLLYDRLVEQRQNIVMAQAAHTTAIVSSLFPKNVRDRLLATGSDRKDGNGSIFSANKSRLRGFLDDGDNGDDDDTNQAPIADLFPECTVYFADIAGFTAWSSTREPEQVFILLQTVYQKFDSLAKRRKVFKVETIGDCYMAVTGLPEPMANHAVTMIRFAWDCNTEFKKITKDLEVKLGPDTTDLAMRFGLHSGPVTAGVLRGDRARFQLFGDTVNTASRMESTGVRNLVHISAVTAEHVRKAGKESWLKLREDPIHAKGKGVMVTYYAAPKQTKSDTGSNSESGSTSEVQRGFPTVNPDHHQPSYKKVNTRLVDWMTDLLMDHTRKVVCMREKGDMRASIVAPAYHVPDGMTCMDEVKDVIEMPGHNPKLVEVNQTYKKTVINNVIKENLRAYVGRIASGYRDNPFHNFEHACHVTMSVSKLLKRVVAPELTIEQIESIKEEDDLASRLHDYTHGIGGDPLLSFAITISALIHDVDHRGVSNTQLIEEEPEMAAKNNNQSVAEQHSLDLSWEILMEDEFTELRQCLFATQAELMRFRQMIVNVVLATDIMDKELNGLRKNRWARAFDEDKREQSAGDTNLRATIVIEHIIQASDVSHTMQHWHVYRKWNERLFMEVYKAYKEGRMDKDPSDGWYKGEIGFFDFYIIPLAKKLKECGVFGVSSDEYLTYATQNRNEWEEKGEEIVEGMLEKVHAQYNEEATTE